MIRKIGGWLVLLISIVVYWLTLEPTTSMWDCSEFISCAAGLQVGHAPGAPVFMLLGRFFSLFAPDATLVAYMVNLLSALASAFTIFFLYHTIYWFGKKILTQSNIKYSDKFQMWILSGSAFIGAITFAFTDTFWFSAVEGEVYATSSFFTALVFWCAIKWEQDASKYANRWLLFIFLLLGLSVGVHLLNLLALPAVALVYYYKKNTPTNKGVLITLVLSTAVMGFIIFGLIPGVVTLTAHTERMFVNGFGLPVYSGALTFVVLLVAATIYAIYYFRKNKKILPHFISLAFALWLIGYSTFTILIIRSNQQPYIDINNVENIYGLVDYLNREQYPKRPLFYGNNYNSPIIDIEQRYTYKLHENEYKKDLLVPNYIFEPSTKVLFPRMASLDPVHTKLYEKWVDIKGRPVTVNGYDGKRKTIVVPTFLDNMKFFFKYQLGYMYGRYFMWNFVGRQNDIQGMGSAVNGNWQSGIESIDASRNIPQKLLPDDLKHNKGSNKYYFLPLLLGILGLYYQFKYDKNNTLIVTLFFLITGVAIVLYMNEIPRTPRERDYAYVGSFYVFAIWIGLGALRLLSLTKNKKTAKYYALVLFPIITLAVPTNMLKENYDDHDRSNRYTTKAHATNLLSSCQKNAVFFTAADNDSYPVWYVQEVEKFRPDILPILKTFLPTGWYIRQLYTNFASRGKLDVTFRSDDFLMGNNISVSIQEKRKKPASAKQIIDFIKSNSAKTKVTYRDGSRHNYIPVRNVFIPINKENFMTTAKGYDIDTSRIPDTLNFKLSKPSISADELIILDIIANNKWKRPIYFLDESMVSNLGLKQYVHREGLLWRLMPYKRNSNIGSNTMYQYNLIMNEFKWGNVNQDIYLDWTHVRTFYSFDYRGMFASVAKDLAKLGHKDKALQILEKCKKFVPVEKIPYGYKAHEIVEAYLKAEDKQNAEATAKEMFTRLNSWFFMYENIPNKNKGRVLDEMYGKMYMLRELINTSRNELPDLSQEMFMRFEELNSSMGG